MIRRLSSTSVGYWPAWGGWPSVGTGEIVAVYSAGYETVPDDLKYAAIKFVQAEIQNAGRDPYLKARTVPGVLEQQWWVDPAKSSVIPPEVMDILSRGGYVNKSGWVA
jgi:hypothetical protein